MRLYIEPTNQCNLACRTCLRNAWDEVGGHMSAATFDRVLDGLRELAPASAVGPDVFFGGYGEPLAHPQIVQMVSDAKALGGQVELITNATLLTETLGRELVRGGLDRLWVSLDGARPDTYADVRLGAELPLVLDNLRRFKRLRPPAHRPHPRIGISFVAMRSNIHDLPDLLELATDLGAADVLVTNLLPHTADMVDQILYRRALKDIAHLDSPWLPSLSLPRMEVGERSARAIVTALESQRRVSLGDVALSSASDRCPFIDRTAAAVGWDGRFSPCLPLLYDQRSFLHGRPRHARHYVVGNVHDRSLSELWNDGEHLAFRERVQRFQFSPCAACGGCENSASNVQDCTGNTFPTCGGCLWAQGIIRCP
jgi:MoaA/NifB/PqqE/SkfB family radical SAM enzyme